MENLLPSLDSLTPFSGSKDEAVEEIREKDPLVFGKRLKLVGIQQMLLLSLVLLSFNNIIHLVIVQCVTGGALQIHLASIGCCPRGGVCFRSPCWIRKKSRALINNHP